MKFIAIVLFLIGTFSFGQRSDFYTISFAKADSIALHNKGASLKNLPVLTHNLTSTLKTDIEKFRAIYTWVCTNIENDYSSYTKTVKKRKKFAKDEDALAEWNAETTPRVFKNLLKDKKTACTGYAYLIRELASLADINCKIINGFGRTAATIIDSKSIPNHSWNAVELNDKWYLCDPTWSAGRIFIDEDGPRFEADYFDGYFLAQPAIFVKNHYPLDIKWTLLEQPPSFEDFVNGPVVYKETFKDNVLIKEPKEMYLEITKNEKLSFRFSTHKVISEEDISIELKSGSISKKVMPKLLKNLNDYYLQYSFEKSGHYDTHIILGGTIIATYVVRVKRK